MKRIFLLSLLLLYPYLLVAEPEIYGSLQYDYQYKHSDSSTPFSLDPNYPSIKNSPSQKKNSSDIKNNDSHIGIKGEKPIGNGNSIIYQIEFGEDGLR